MDSLNNIYLAGEIEYVDTRVCSDVIVAKFDSFGNYLWNSTWGNKFENEICLAFALDSNNNIYLSGAIDSSKTRSFDFLLVKFDESGGLLWNYTWGRKNMDEYFDDIIIDLEKKIYLGGSLYRSESHSWDITVLNLKEISYFPIIESYSLISLLIVITVILSFLVALTILLQYFKKEEIIKLVKSYKSLITISLRNTSLNFHHLKF